MRQRSQRWPAVNVLYAFATTLNEPKNVFRLGDDAPIQNLAGQPVPPLKTRHSL